MAELNKAAAAEEKALFLFDKGTYNAAASYLSIERASVCGYLDIELDREISAHRYATTHDLERIRQMFKRVATRIVNALIGKVGISHTHTRAAVRGYL